MATTRGAHYRGAGRAREKSTWRSSTHLATQHISTLTCFPDTSSLHGLLLQERYLLDQLRQQKLDAVAAAAAATAVPTSTGAGAGHPDQRAPKMSLSGPQQQQ